MPIALAVCICQCASGRCAADARVIQNRLDRLKAGDQAAQAFPAGQLCKGRIPELIEEGKSFDRFVAVVAIDACLEST